jgi:polar amino acid transport system substrate-binding protein
MKKYRLFCILVLVALLASACSPSAKSTQAPAASSGATPVAQVPADKLAQKGHLLICSDIPYPPMEYFDDNGNAIGLDIDMGNEIAARLGLKPQFVNSVFDTIIAAVKSGKCDIILSGMNVTDTRKKQVSMIPYFKAGQALVVVKGNPKKINGPLDLCGQAVAAESGTTNADWLQGANDYKDMGMPADCKAAGKEAPNAIVTQKDSDAFQQLQSGKVVAYATDSPVAGYYTKLHGDQFEAAGQVIDPIAVGLVVNCDEEDCSNAPLSALGQAVQTALNSMFADGTYTKILTTWGLTAGSIK